ncbi:MAG: hypothetical protein ABR583_06170 [Gaiellaceae bacterium]
MGGVTIARARIALAAIVAMAAAVVFAAPASATHGVRPSFDPQTTNVPYLAWRGEELRLVKCSDEINVTEDEAGNPVAAGEGQSVDWIVEDWSGYPFQPPSLEASTVKFFLGTGEHADQGCVKADYVSLKAGLAQIKLVLSDSDTGNPAMKHQFLAGWLALNNPNCRELAVTDQPGGGGSDIGDPDGSGDLVAGGLPGRVQCDVSGELPLGNNFTELGLPASITLPAETPFTDLRDVDNTYWDDLAARMATTSDARPVYRDAPWRMWDIHDDRARTEGHVNQAVCLADPITGLTGPHTLLDAVDACRGTQGFLGGLLIGDAQYSRVFGDLSRFPTWGPFDPLRPDETLLPDGKLDGGDVPLPSARVDVAIAANSGSATDISGVGSLSTVLKCVAYTRRNNCDPRPHSHYAPFYSRWIPATTANTFTPVLDPQGNITQYNAVATDEASGTDGPARGNNYPGYRTSGLYDYWSITEVLRSALGGNTQCLRRNDARVPLRQLPLGPQAVVTYSDEHGEVQAYFNPGLGFFFDNLGVGTNLNNACDLEGVDVLGTADIQAIARYPYQKTTDSDKASNVLQKRVHSRFHKGVTCVPKGPIPPITNGLAFICTAVAIDIDGNPFVNEKVCFMTNGEGAREYPLGRASQQEGLHRLCVWTDSRGEASIEVFGKCIRGNVIAEFVAEGIIRFAIFDFACPPGAAGGTGVSGSATGSQSSSSATAPFAGSQGDIVPGASTAQTQKIIEQAKADAKAKPAAAPKKATLAFARIAKKPFAKQSERYVVVRVNGAARTAKIEITLVGKNGRVLGKVVRTIATNRTVRVPNLKLPKVAKTARVRVLG